MQVLKTRETFHLELKHKRLADGPLGKASVAIRSCGGVLFGCTAVLPYLHSFVSVNMQWHAQKLAHTYHQCGWT